MTLAQARAAIARLMADGRERTRDDIRLRVPAPEPTFSQAMQFMVRRKLIVRMKVCKSRDTFTTYRKHMEAAE